MSAVEETGRLSAPVPLISSVVGSEMEDRGRENAEEIAFE
jgi:hypothetical protein